MNPNLSDWDEDLPPEPKEVYQDLVRALKRKSGFGLFFVQCTPAEADRLVATLPQDIPHKKIAVLRLLEPIDNLYQQVAEFVKDKQVDILLIKGLEYSLYKYEQRTFGEITGGQFSNLASVPPILNHLNQQRERFRDDFPISFVFLLRSFSINYLIHRAPDFFDWRSGVFELPTTPEVLQHEANRLLEEGKSDGYRKLSHKKKIEKVLEIQELLNEKNITNSNKAILLCEMGKLLVAAKQYEGAVAYFNDTVTMKSNYYLAWHYCGIALSKLKQFEKAVSSYVKAIEIKPDYQYSWSNKGNALRNIGRNEEAIASFDQAVKIRPDYYLAWNNRGITLRNLGRNEEAIASFDQAVKIRPDYYLAWNNRGITLRNLGRNEEAIASFDQAVKIRPDYYLAWNNRGIVLGNHLQQYKKAITSFDQAVYIQPELHQAWYNRGIALSKLKRFQEAIASLEKALKIKPDDHKTWYA
ncbi:MAG: tetratricopeptide repeat protein, partial [Tolypothrix sp. Co-bin9]|nr:tetratricopeptide repeat protein [Tolypothrix sp. Co-bin9]